VETNLVVPSLLGDVLNAEYYKRSFHSISAALRAAGAVRLDSICRGINVGFTGELSSVYVSSGVKLFRVSNIDGVFLTDNEVMFVPVEFDTANRQCRIGAGDVVLAAVGNTIGKVGVTPRQIESAQTSRALMIVRPDQSKTDSHYLVIYLATKYGQSSIIRGISGSAQPVLNTPLVQNIQVYQPSTILARKYIGDKVRQAEQLRTFANSLADDLISRFSLRERRTFSRTSKHHPCTTRSLAADAAKLLVEALIERNISEADLIHAQTLLEQGNDSADRAILSRLYEGGFDATEPRPLFPDLDAYYETLRMVEREQTEVAAK
jgi:type I restriction enzyme, S subunit